MDPKHVEGPSPDEKHPPGDKPEEKAQQPGQSGRLTGKHGTQQTDPMVGPPPMGGDSLVDLGLPGAPTSRSHDENAMPPSGISVIEWAALVENDPPTDSGSDPKFDAPSDAEWLKQTMEEHGSLGGQPAHTDHPGESGVDLLGGTSTGSASRSDLSGVIPQLEEEVPSFPGAAGDGSAEDDADALADDLEVVRSAFPVGGSSDSIERLLAPVPEVEEVQEPRTPLNSADVVQLGADMLHQDDPFGERSMTGHSGVEIEPATQQEPGVLDSEPVDLENIASGFSVPNLGEALRANAQDAVESGVHLDDDDEGLNSDQLAAAMLAGREGTDETPSGRDLIAEQVESGVDLSKSMMDFVDDEMESEAGQAGASASDPRMAGKVESAVIDTHLVQDVPQDDGTESVSLGETPSSKDHASSVNLSGAPPKKTLLDRESDDTGDMEMGAASGLLVNSALDYTNVPEIEEPKVRKKQAKPLEPDEVDFGSDEDVEVPATDGDVLTEEETSPETAAAAAAAERKSRVPAGVGGWIGGGLVGAVVATGACAALWFSGLLSGGQAQTKQPIQQQRPPVAKAEPTFEAKLASLRNGDFDSAKDAGFEQIDENNAEQVVARGEYRWVTYFRQQRLANPNQAIAPDADQVKQALEDLDKVAKNESAPAPAKADALFWTGQIQEMTGKVEEARKTYAAAAAQFKADPVLGRRFNAAITRLDLRSPRNPAVGLQPLDEQERLVLVALLLPLLQAPTDAKQQTTEAGFDFWEAVDLARKQNYVEAQKKLQSARELHDKRRFEQLRKSQNPTSDPNEEIFLRVCDELKEYWQLAEAMRAGGYLAKDSDANKALTGLLGYVGDAAKRFQSEGQKLVEAKIIADPKDLAKGIDQLLADRKNSGADAGRIAKLADELVKAKVIDKPENFEQGLVKLLDERKTAATEIADLKSANAQANAEAEKQKDLASATAAKLKAQEDVTKAVKHELVDAKYLQADAGDDRITQGVKDLVKVATTDSTKEATRKLQVELSAAKDQLAQRWQHHEMLSIWLPVLEDRSQKEAIAKALQDADRVTKDPAATPGQKARAEVIRGLALRNEEKFSEANAALQKAKAALPGEDKAWQNVAGAALAEVANPGSAYRQRAETLEKQGKYDDAIAVLTHAVEALPQDKGTLLARKSLLELDAARAKATSNLTGDEPMLVAAQKDAKAATAAGTAMGFYAVGRLAEEVGKYDDAVQNYRQAVAASKDASGDGSLYRIALARILLLTRPDKAAPKEAPKVGKIDVPSVDLLLGLVAFTLQPPAAQPSASAEEAAQLADEILRLDPAKVPYEIRAQALGIKGQWTEALRTYAEGLRSALDRPHAEELQFLIDSNPNLKGMESSRLAASPLMAEVHYGAGIRHYFDKRYDDAEKEFVLAIKNDGQDARYHYFLGLARLAQNKDKANADFAEGALLEAHGRPSRAAVSTALERIQGPARTVLNETRDKLR